MAATTSATIAAGKANFFRGNLMRTPIFRRIAALVMICAADELVLRMNRAAEAALPEAKALFVGAINLSRFGA